MKPLSKSTMLPESGIRRMFDLAKDRENIVSFVLGEPDFTTPRHIIEAAKKALDAGMTHYTDNAGLLELRQAIAAELARYDKVQYAASEILVSTGAMEIIYLIFATLLNPGDEVLITNPCYANYYGQISMNHGIPVPVPVKEEEGFQFTYECMKPYITPRTKAVFLNSPCNPTGSVASRKTMEEIARIALEYDLYVVYDAVYKHLIYDNAEYINIASLEGMRERTLYIDSFSKTYAMTGWRVGYLAGPGNIVSLMPKLHEFMPSCVSSFSQYGALEALLHGKEDIKHMNGQYTLRRNAMLECISNMPLISCNRPDGAFYIFANIKQTGISSCEFAEGLLKEEGVVVAPGSAFGTEGEGYIRLSYATSLDNIYEGMKRMKDFLSRI